MDVPLNREKQKAHAHATVAKAATAEADIECRYGEWEVGLFDCFTHCVPNCWMACCCSWISLAQITTRLGIATYSKALWFFLTLELSIAVVSSLANADPKHNLTIALACGGIASYLVSLKLVAIWHLRHRTRKKFRIPGSCQSDCVASVLCSCCAIAQTASHVKSYTPGECDFGAPYVLREYEA